MRFLILMVLSWAVTAAEFGNSNPDGERLYAEKSFAKAHDTYAKLDTDKMSADEKRWVNFRRADTLWRGVEAQGDEDIAKTAFENAEQSLDALVQGRDRADEQDRVWAEAEESLGQLLLSQRGGFRPLPLGRRIASVANPSPDRRNEGWTHLEKALNWWAGSSDVELARQRYIALTWWIFAGNRFYEAPQLAFALENVAKIAAAPDDKAHAHFMLGQIISQRGNAYEIDRVNAEFEAALAVGKASECYDDALVEYAQWLMRSGRVKWDDQGNPSAQPNPRKALELLRKLVAEFNERTSPHFRRAKAMIQQIEAPVLNVNVSSMFLPKSAAQFDLSFKNVRQIEFTLRRVDVTRDFEFPGENRRYGNWGAMIKAGAGQVVKRWTKDLSNREEFVDQYEAISVDGKLDAGAYVLEATGAGLSAQDLLLITDVAVIANTGTDRAAIFVCNAETGAPIAKASVKLLELFYNGRVQTPRAREAQTGNDGVAEFPAVEKTRPINQAFALVNIDGKPGITSVYPAQQRQQNEGEWKLYVVTDRPAYRPAETMHWKVTARRLKNDIYTTPSGAAVSYTIMDPRGQKVKEGKVTLNSFGSAWGDFDLTAAMTLGEYRIVFAEEKQSYIGAGQFRLEEYKLPEFKVSVQTPEENGRPKTFRLGEKVDVTVRGEYYFGGAVANAAVHVIVRKNPLYHIYSEPRAYPWYFADFGERYMRWRDQGVVALEKDLTTDAEGKATFSLETASYGTDDLEFMVEARMTDSSRREIIGNGYIRVTKHRYEVHAHPKHWLHRPSDKAEIEFRALDANDQGVSAEGKVIVTRDYWYEVWEDAAGREIKGNDLKAAQNAKNFPPEGWKLKFRGYEKEDITSATIETDTDGKADFSFTPTKEGYYRITWLSEDKRPDGTDGPPIKTETTLWVANDKSTELGYRHGDLEIIVDKDTFRAGQKASVMLHTPANDRWVFLTIVTDRIMRRETIHLDGTVKLLEIDIGEEHVPNFWLQAVMVHDGQIHRDQKEIVVPPAKNFLDVQVTPDKPTYRVRDEGKYVVTTKDHEGKPVTAEIEFGVINEALFYIQQEYAGDPRQFFFGQKRFQTAMISSTFDYRAFSSVRRSDLQTFSRDSETRTMSSPVMAKSKSMAMGRFEAAGRGFAAAPASAESMAMGGSLALADNKAALGATNPEPIVRSDFRSTIFWQPDVTTDADGTARVSIQYPDSVTTWKATARAATSGNQFGISSASTKTTQPLIVRLQAPRFFVVGDEVVVSAVINNNTSNRVTVIPEIFVEGLTLRTDAARESLRIEANAEARVDWKVSAEKMGETKIRVTAKSSDASDSMERTFPVYEHGIEKFISESGKFNGGEALVKINLPAARRKDSARLTVQVTPSLAVTMVDALPYLLDYPYGCTEQTMSRFLPAAIIAKTLTDVGIDAETAMSRAFGGIEAASIGKTQPKGKRNLDRLNEIVQQGLERLRDMQHGDGGWGWWKEGSSDSWMTAYVVWGLALAQQAKLDIDPQLIESGSKYLTSHLVEAENSLDLQTWMLHACAATGPNISESERKAIDNIWSKREQLNSYSRALFAWAMNAFGEKDKAATLARNLENGLHRGENSGSSVILKGGSNLPTAHWGATGGWWHWSDSPTETTAFALRALLAIEPQNKLIDSTANWLIKNRRGAQWSNTRDTAITLLSLTDFLKKSGELKSEGEYAITVNGSEVTAKKFTPQDVLNAPSRFEIDSKLLRDGANEIRIVRKSGQGPLYFAAEAKYFSLEEPITPAANEIFARRQYYRLVPKPTLLNGNAYERVLLKDGETINSGDRLEVSILVESKNNYEYLLFEDLKPGGFEAVQIRSGEGAYARQVKTPSSGRAQLTDDDYTSNTRWIYQEMRDRKVASFIDQLPQGFWELRYELRAETPGKFHALPTLGHAMYVPEIRCNTAEQVVQVVEPSKQ